MTKEQETAEFHIELEGGEAPFTYRWVVESDEGKEYMAQPKSTKDRSSTFSYEFFDADFCTDHKIYVYCIVTDSKGNSVTSKTICVIRKE